MPERSDMAEGLEKMASDMAGGLEKIASEYKQSIRKSNPDAHPDKNFTWEHFFTVHCGVLPDDARKYEKALIAHRLDPLDTLRESLGLIIEYARIPIGDKLKITKTIQAKEKEIESKEEAMKKAKKSLGLEKYNDFEVGMIMACAGGDSEYHIDYGIEQFEEGMHEIERMVNVQMVKDPKSAKSYSSGAALARIAHNPTLQFLQSFGYDTFEYTKDKTVAASAVPSRPTTSNPVVETLLLGNLTERLDLNESVPDHMYS